MPAPVRRRRWPVILLVLLVALAGGAAAVHLKVMPLEVAVAWLKPANLSIDSEPPGASVKLDGRELPDKTPLRTEVKRDRAEHTLEFTREGSLPARATMRFDRSVALVQRITLTDEPPPPPPPPAAPEPIAEPAPAAPVEPEAAAAPDDVKAEKKAETKKADKKKKGKKKKAKAGKKAKAADEP